MKVLLVDDEEDIRNIGHLSLTAVGKLQVVTASSAAEGIAAARAERPDVILMDMMMPGTDGLSALEALRADADLKQIPVIFMTAKVQRHEVEHYLEVGALGVIQKPFDPMALPGEIRALMDAEAPK